MKHSGIEAFCKSREATLAAYEGMIGKVPCLLFGVWHSFLNSVTIVSIELYTLNFSLIIELQRVKSFFTVKWNLTQ